MAVAGQGVPRARGKGFGPPNRLTEQAAVPPPAVGDGSSGNAIYDPPDGGSWAGQHFFFWKLREEDYNIACGIFRGLEPRTWR